MEENEQAHKERSSGVNVALGQGGSTEVTPIRTPGSCEPSRHPALKPLLAPPGSGSSSRPTHTALRAFENGAPVPPEVLAWAEASEPPYSGSAFFSGLFGLGCGNKMVSFFQGFLESPSILILCVVLLAILRGSARFLIRGAGGQQRGQ